MGRRQVATAEVPEVAARRPLWREDLVTTPLRYCEELALRGEPHLHQAGQEQSFQLHGPTSGQESHEKKKEEKMQET